MKQRLTAALVAVVLSTSGASAGPVRLTDALLDRISAGRLAPESEIEQWVWDYVQYRKSRGKVSTWEKELTKANLAKRVAVKQGGKNASGPREVHLSGGDTLVFRVASLNPLQAAKGKEWVYR